MKRFLRRGLGSGLLIDRLGRRFGDSVLLTFDDGPHPEATPAILGLLKAYGARAVFFVVGDRIRRAPELLARIVREGHVLGNHSYRHDPAETATVRAYAEDVSKCQEEVFRYAGVRPSVHRPPLGTISIASLLAPRTMGLKTVLWSRSSEDWRFRSNAEAESCARTMIGEVRPRDILLFHDETMHTVRLLSLLLPALRSSGYRMDPCIESALRISQRLPAGDPPHGYS